MPLIIGTTPSSQWQNLIPVLNAMGWTSQQSAPDTWYQDTTVPFLVGDYCLVLHSRPEYAVAWLMDAGQEPEQALLQWQVAAEHLLAFYKRYRSTVVVANVNDIMVNPGGLIEWLQQNHPLFSQHLQGISSGWYSLDLQAEPSKLSLLIATQLVSQSVHLVPLLSQLEACSLPLIEGHCAPPVLDLKQLYQQLKTDAEDEKRQREGEWTSVLKKQEEALGVLGEENKLLLDQLLSTQNELAAAVLDAKRQAVRVGELSDSLQTLQYANVQLEQENLVLAEQKPLLEQTQVAIAEKDRILTDVKDENTLLLEQLFSVQEELERQFLSKNDLEKELVAVRQQQEQALKQLEQEKERLIAEFAKKNTQLKQEVAEEKKQFEQKLAEQHHSLNQVNDDQLLRAQEALAAAKKDQEQLVDRIAVQEAGLKEENDLILKQLFSVQEELEKYYLKNQSLEKLLASQQAQITEKNRKLKKLSDDKKHLKSLVQELQPPEPVAVPEMPAANRKNIRGLKIVRLLGRVRPSRRSIKQHTRIVADSPLFDASWYVQTYSDISSSKLSPAEHYVRHGGFEGRDPGPDFSSNHYLALNPDVAQTGMNPLVHYLLHGKSEGRAI